MRKSLLIVYFFAVLNLLNGQEPLFKDLRFIVSYEDFEPRSKYPRNGEKNESFYLKLMVKVDADSLVVLDTLNYPPFDKRLINISHFKSDSIILFTEKNLYNRESFSTWISVLDYSDSLILNRCLVDSAFQNYLYDQNNFIIKIDSQPYIFNLQNGDSLNGFGVDFKIENLPDNIESISISDLSGMNKFDQFRLRLLFNKDKNTFSLPQFKFPSLKGEDLFLKFIKPNNFKGNSFNIVGSSEKYLAGIPLGGQLEDTLFRLSIYDIKNEKWTQFVNDKPFSSVTFFGDWLLGNQILKSKRKERGLYIDLSYENKYIEKYGRPIYFDYEYPGLLFFYHIPSQSFYTIQTNNPDSEILGGIDDFIILRVFDKIEVVQLSPNTGVGARKTLVEDPFLVPYIHNLIFSKYDRFVTRNPKFK